MTHIAPKFNMTDLYEQIDISSSPFIYNDSMMFDDFDIKDLGSSYNSKLNTIEENLISSIFSIVIVLGMYQGYYFIQYSK